ncbi:MULTISPECIES: TolC family protein [unclassified Thioalkalivibrio]|uniref:TolC family protein n=1 Tax=unclassified Thioalkalivibrio TaxID=2621013 RepID=UPI00037D9E2E|nr:MULTISPECIES: TolC family protein [unclassified Thioalkalivibrio]
MPRTALPFLVALALALPAHASEAPDASDGLRLSLPPDALTDARPFEREAVAEETLSLEEAVARALENNRGLRAERLQTAIQGTFEAQERAVFDPELFAELEISRDQSVRQLEQIGETDEVTTTRRFGEAGLSQSLPTGTDLTVSVRSSRSSSSRVETPQFTTRAGLTLTQALLRGGRIESNLVRLRQAGLDVEASEYEVRGFVEQLITDVEGRYWDLVLADERIAIFEEALAVAREQLDQTERRIAAGDRPETEAVSARAEVALRRQGLIDARAERARAQDSLARLLQGGNGGLWDTRLEASSEPGLERYALEPLDTYVALARDHRADINETRLRVQRNQLEVVRTRNGLLPRLDFFVTLGQSGYADSFSRTWRDRQGDGYDLAAGLRFEMPIGNRAAEAEHTRARLTRQQIQETLANLEQLAIEDVRGTWFDAARVREQIQAQEETIELQEELLRVEQTRFRVGAGTALAVAQAQRDLLESRLNLTETVVRFRQLTTELLNASGTLLLHRGIDAPGAERVEIRL